MGEAYLANGSLAPDTTRRGGGRVIRRGGYRRGQGKRKVPEERQRPKRVSSGVGVRKRRGFQYSVVIKLLSGLFEDHLSL
jgi:hypothetical protein